MVFDFHTHSTLSDGALSPLELIRRAAVNGYRAIAVTDHCGPGSLARLIAETAEDCALAQAHWGIVALAGVELTHLPPAAIDEAARRAKTLGARIVVVHGETLTEPVEPGTNLAAVRSRHVDILAHPGFLSDEEARLAAQNGVFLEISARQSHALANGHVARTAVRADAGLLVCSDAHAPADLLTAEWAKLVARGAGMNERQMRAALEKSPRVLVRKIGLTE
jgi:putative hydrolase